MAEAMFNQMVAGKHEATSAGTQVPEDNGQKLKDRPGAVHTLAVLNELGIDASEKQRTQLTPEILDKADKVIVMAEPATIPEYLSARADVEYWQIADAFGFDIDSTRVVRDDIKERVTALIKFLD